MDEYTTATSGSAIGATLTLESILAIYDSLPKLQPLPEAMIVPQRMMNRIASMTAETITHAPFLGIKTYLNPYPITLPKPFRARYKTRAGYKHARKHWRAVNREIQNSILVLSNKFGQSACRHFEASIASTFRLNG